MSGDRLATITAGALYCLGLVAGLFSVAPVIDRPDYLVQIPAHVSQITAAALCQFLMMAAYVGMAVALYPTLQTYHLRLALGYLGFRLVAAALIVVGVLLLLLLLALGQEAIKTAAPVAAHVQMIGEILRTARDLINHVGMILVLSMGSLLLNTLLYQTKLVPRWLAGWGLAGTILAIVASCLFLARSVDLLTAVSMNFPLALQELVFAGWLLVKGFNAPAPH